MSCMTPLAEGMRVSVDDPEARLFRKSVIEWLMLNHPHDCPVCDEGGECHLQDMTVMTGHDYRRTRARKRTYRNQYLGPFINHEMNRCIQCYRCVRYYRGVAGGGDLNVFACHDNVYFGRHEDGVLESEFSGNLVEICPTGVFTDKTLKEHYTRKWDLQTAPSVCVLCGVGCNTVAGERYGTLRRILNRYHHEVNGYFLCDRGRFGYGFVNSDKRIRTPLISPSLSPSRQGREMKAPSPPAGEGRGEGEASLRQTTKESALRRIADILSESKGIIGIGSPRASLESNYALRALVGPDNFYSGMSSPEHRLVSLVIDILHKGPARIPSLRDIQSADAVLILGEDVTNTAPMMALALRQAAGSKRREIAAGMKIPEWDDSAVRHAAQDAMSPVYIAAAHPTKLDDVAARTCRAAPDDIARLGFAVAHELDPSAPALPPLPSGERAGVRGELDVRSLAKEIARALKDAKRPLVISGTSLFNEAIVQAAANVARALCSTGKPAGLGYAVPECNTLGLGLMGGRTLNEAFTVMQDDLADTVIVLENDLYRRAPSSSVDQFLGKARHIIVLDHLLNPTSSRAGITFPASTFAETAGTLVNYEGRAQRFYQVFVPQGDVQAGWKWIDDIIKIVEKQAVGHPRSLDDLAAKMAAALPVFKPVQEIAPAASFRIESMKVPRQAHRYSGRTAMNANVNVSEPRPPEDLDSPLSFSMEGYEGRPPSALTSRYWSPGWNSVQALNKFQQETGGPLRGGDPGRRLIEPAREGKPSYFTDIPAPSHMGEKELSSLPRYFIFGSEELSVLSPGIAELMKPAHGS